MIHARIIGFIFGLLTALSATAQSDQPQVKHAGALKNFKMKGDISAKFDLKELDGKQNLYALGALEKLKGEIQIFGSMPYHSLVANGELAFDTTLSKKASLIVYAQVPFWQEIAIPNHIATHARMEAFIADAADKHGINTEAPFPFLITGNAGALQWHVIDWDENDKEHSHQKHIASGLNGELEHVDVKILGFYSSKHKAIFTHHTTNMHMHFITADKKLAGHVDHLKPGQGMQLHLPEFKKNTSPN